MNVPDWSSRDAVLPPPRRVIRMVVTPPGQTGVDATPALASELHCFLVAIEERMMSTLDPLDAAIEALGDPRYRSDEVAIFEVDCVEALQMLDQALFPLVVTSPPYNIGKAYEKPLPMRDYLSWCESWLKGLHSVCLPDSAFWLNLGYVPLDGVGKAIPLPYLLWERSPFFLIQEVVWNYGAGVASRHSFSPRNEKFLWYVKDPSNYYFDLDAVRDPDVKYPNQKKNGKLKCNPLGKNPTDVWAFPKVTSGANRSSKERTKHPAQFPLAVIERIILATSRPGDVILDPFMGSGTVAEAAVRHGRRAVGFEIEPDYIDIAGERLDRLAAAPRLPLGEVAQ
jgi:adenine-specific DNA-methyltransferase